MLKKELISVCVNSNLLLFLTDVKKIECPDQLRMSDINKVAEIIEANTQSEMEAVKASRDYETRMHKDPYVEAKVYLAKNDVYDLFKVSATLALNSPCFFVLQIGFSYRHSRLT